MLALLPCLLLSFARPPLALRTARYEARPTAVRCAEDPALERVQVVVPDGMYEGAPFTVQAAWGSQFEVVVPPGCGPGSTIEIDLPLPTPSAAETAAPAEPSSLLDNILPPVDNPFVTSKADRLRAKYGEDAVVQNSARSGGRLEAEERLAADLAKFKAERGVSDEPEEETLIGRVINVLGTVLTCNFFIIISFFAWFLVGCAAQFGWENYVIIGAFQANWEVFILPLLTTHMTLTFLSYGLEKVSGAVE